MASLKIIVENLDDCVILVFLDFRDGRFDSLDAEVFCAVYRSSAKNAMRVARTETNIAYRRADHERWLKMPFVRGKRVQMSHNHPMHDICDDLAGDYPKDFVFDGWHPQCWCYAVPILVDASEMQKVNEAFLRGEEYTPQGEQITDYPQGFKDFVRDNADNIKASRARGTEPYFVRNNAEVVDKILNPKEPTSTSISETPKVERFNATTPQEIKNFILENIADDCTLEIKKADLDLWNNIVNQLNERMQEFGLPKFTNLGKPANRQAEASWDGHDNSMNFNIPFLRNQTAVKRGEKWKKKGILYSFAYDNPDDYVRAVIDHELGHALMSKYNFKNEVISAFGKAGRSIIINGKPFAEINDVLGYYASTSVDEYFAEAFSFYMGKNRDKLGSQTKAMMEKFMERVDLRYHKKGGSIIANDELSRKVFAELKDKTLATLTKEQKDNAKDIASNVGASLVQPMKFKDIDNGNVNPKYGQSKKYEINCALSVITAEARARGVDAEALGVIIPKNQKTMKAYELGYDITSAFIDPKTKKSPELIVHEISGSDDLLKHINELTAQNGRYYIGFESESLNHMLNAYRINGKLYIYDQQINGSYDLIKLLTDRNAKSIEVLHLDGLLFDTTFISQWMKG